MHRARRELGSSGESLRFACVLDPLKRSPSAVLDENGGAVTLTVKMNSGTDVWTLPDPADAASPSEIISVRDGHELLHFTSADRAPRGDANQR